MTPGQAAYEAMFGCFDFHKESDAARQRWELCAESAIKAWLDQLKGLPCFEPITDSRHRGISPTMKAAEYFGEMVGRKHSEALITKFKSDLRDMSKVEPIAKMPFPPRGYQWSKITSELKSDGGAIVHMEAERIPDDVQPDHVVEAKS